MSPTIDVFHFKVEYNFQVQFGNLSGFRTHLSIKENLLFFEATRRWLIVPLWIKPLLLYREEIRWKYKRSNLISMNNIDVNGSGFAIVERGNISNHCTSIFNMMCGDPIVADILCGMWH